MRPYPHLYEINARLFTRRMSEKYGRNLTLATIPVQEWQSLARRGFDLVWLMGVWQRSPGARQKALHHEALRREYDRVLPGWTEADVAGSPFAVHSYELDSPLGKPGDLSHLRSRLNRLGLGLILDFIPNHVALDHPWTLTHPGRFIQVTGADVLAHPDAFFKAGGGACLAHGRDPNFPPWTDTAQLNFFSPDLREALSQQLLQLTQVADGVRCDMAMLALNDVFQGIWGKRAGYSRPDTELWSEAIARVKQKRKDFLFLAEAYWGLEPKLKQLGFDFTYDKALYDRLRFSNAGDIRNYLTSNEPSPPGPVCFIENHDEERAVTAFGRERSQAAAVVLCTLPCLRLLHDGQIEGRRLRVPVQLVREPEEAEDTDMAHFYEQLLTACNAPPFHEGKWSLLANGQNDEARNLLTWCWRFKDRTRIVVVNYSPERSLCWLKLPPSAGKEGKVALHEDLTQKTNVYDEQPGSPSLYLDLQPWESQILDVPAAPGSG